MSPSPPNTINNPMPVGTISCGEGLTTGGFERDGFQSAWELTWTVAGPDCTHLDITLTQPPGGGLLFNLWSVSNSALTELAGGVTSCQVPSTSTGSYIIQAAPSNNSVQGDFAVNLSTDDSGPPGGVSCS